MKIMTIVGTRPELIRLSRVIALLDKSVDHVLVHTGQNYDPLLSDVFIQELGIPVPDHFLNISTTSLGASLGDILSKSESVMLRENPDAVLILGDTNSAISSIVARRLGIPVFHMEAGNRCFDDRVPEEINRRVVDHVSSVNLVYTEHARRNLLSEGMHPENIVLTGSPMREVLDFYLPQIKASGILNELNLSSQSYFVVSIHREELVDNSERLSEMLETLTAIREKWRLDIVVSTHPRTRKRLEPLLDKKNLVGISFHEPFGFFDYIQLQMNAKCVLSDSGTISEESAILGFPAITLRERIERPEAIDSGVIITSGFQRDSILESLGYRIDSDESFEVPADYLVKNTSHRVLNTLLSYVNRKSA